MLGLGLGMIISAMTTKYRDLTFLISLRHTTYDVFNYGYLSAIDSKTEIPALSMDGGI